MIVYLVRDIRPFVMYCINGKPRSSLLIESTDSMVESTDSMVESTYSMIYIYTVFHRINTVATILFTEHNLRLQFKGGH